MIHEVAVWNSSKVIIGFKPYKEETIHPGARQGREGNTWRLCDLSMKHLPLKEQVHNSRHFPSKPFLKAKTFKGPDSK